jgi:hypothetical protein
MMAVHCLGKARVKHASSGAIFTIDRNDLHWDAVSADEREMGPETCFQAVLDHPDLGVLCWSVWEYPYGMENDRETDVGPHELLEDFRYGLEHVPDAEDAWIDYATPDDPYEIFLNSCHRTADILADHGSGDGRDILNRMVFAHQVTALEAYLGDTLINAVLSDPAAMTRLMSDDKELSKERFSLVQIQSSPNFVRKAVRAYLRSILYHNLPKVDFLYWSALQVRVLDPAADNGPLIQAINYRHDCVHRNGFDAEGVELKVSN